MLHKELDLLKPRLADMARRAIVIMKSNEKLKELGVTDIAISETFRDVSTQMAYYSRGRMPNVNDVQEMYRAAGLWKITAEDARKPITWTMNSKHLTGDAIDLVPMRGSVTWWAAPKEVWERMGEIGESVGMAWGGRWKNADTPHFEMV